jgi:hypothetical protein
MNRFGVDSDQFSCIKGVNFPGEGTYRRGSCCNEEVMCKNELSDHHAVLNCRVIGRRFLFLNPLTRRCNLHLQVLSKEIRAE